MIDDLQKLVGNRVLFQYNTEYIRISIAGTLYYNAPIYTVVASSTVVVDFTVDVIIGVNVSSNVIYGANND